MKKTISYSVAFFIAAFGLLTLFLSASVIFDLFGIRAKEGNYVLFIVWANFISSIIYLIASYGFVKNKNWTSTILGISALILIYAFICFIIYMPYKVLPDCGMARLLQIPCRPCHLPLCRSSYLSYHRRWCGAGLPAYPRHIPG